MPQPDPQSQGAAPPMGGGAPPDQGGQSSPSFQAPGSELQVLLAKWSQVAEQMAAGDPRLAAGAQKVREGIRDMQTALVTPQQPTPRSQQPKY